MYTCLNRHGLKKLNKVIWRKNTHRVQRGAIALMTAISLLVLLGFATLSIDLGYLYVVRNELQNASDSAAMSGAGYFYKGTNPRVPDWSLAEQNARNSISLNKSNVTLTDGTVDSGYWDVTGIKGLQSQSITPGINDLPAVRVVISKEKGKNAGAVSLFFAGILGIPTSPVAAKAVAVVSFPGYVGPSGLFPFALSSCLFTNVMANLWDLTTTPPRPKNDPSTGLPYIFNVGSSYHYDICDSGQWTSFNLNKNDVTTVRDLIENGNPTGLSIGDDTWIEPGTKNSLFTDVDNCSAAGDKSCEYVTFPVVMDPPGLDSFDTHATQKIESFACVRILSATGGSGKYITVQLSNRCTTPNSGGIGPAQGAVTPPRLAQ